MIRLILFTILTVFPLVTLAQNPVWVNLKTGLPPIDSTKGHSLPAFDTVRTLVILTRFPEEEEQPTGDWPLDATAPPAWTKELLSSSRSSLPDSSLTDYFLEASQGRFYYWGEYFPEIVVLDSMPEYYHQRGKYGGTNTEILQKVVASGKVDWAKYDNWSRKNGRWIKQPDGVIDHISIIYRTSPIIFGQQYASWTGSQGGVASLSMRDLAINDSMKFDGSSLGSGLLVHGSGRDMLEVWKHEVAHFLTRYHYSAHNDHYIKTFTQNGSWGLASLFGSSSMMANAWDREYLGWGQYGQIFPAEEQGPVEFRLRDFVTTGDMVKIELPYVRSEYFLLTFHGNESQFDQVDRGADGLFIMHQFGELGPHHLDLEEADGNYDYELAQPEKQFSICCGEQFPVRRLRENPLLGFGDRDNLKLDKDGDSTVEWSHDLMKVPVLLVEGEEELLHYRGDRQDGWTPEKGRNRFGIDTNPASSSTGKIRNRGATYLNGIQIQVLEMDSETVTVRVDFDQFDIHQDVRWTGKVVLRDSLRVLPGAELLLDQSGTPNNYNHQPPKANLHVENGGSITLLPGAELVLRDEAELTLEEGSRIYVMDGARVVIGRGSSITAKDGSPFILQSQKAEVVWE